MLTVWPVKLGVNAQPPSIKKCTAILRGIHVNLREFLHIMHTEGNLSAITRVSTE